MGAKPCSSVGSCGVADFLTGFGKDLDREFPNEASVKLRLLHLFKDVTEEVFRHICGLFNLFHTGAEEFTLSRL